MRGAPGTIPSVWIGSGVQFEVPGKWSDRLVRRGRLSESSGAVATLAGRRPGERGRLPYGQGVVSCEVYRWDRHFDDRRPSSFLQAPPPISTGFRLSPPAILPGVAGPVADDCKAHAATPR